MKARFYLAPLGKSKPQATFEVCALGAVPTGLLRRAPGGVYGVRVKGLPAAALCGVSNGLRVYVKGFSFGFRGLGYAAGCRDREVLQGWFGILQSLRRLLQKVYAF